MTETRVRIGVFDSGVGGLSVWKALQKTLPAASFIYVADQAYCPYGNRSQAEIVRRAVTISDFLRRAAADLIVVACNTASAAALDTLRSRWPNFPFVGIEPAVKPAALHSHSGHIAVLATRSTLQAPRFHSLVNRFGRNVTLHRVVGEGLVELIERGELNGPAVRRQLQALLSPLPPTVDQVVLGCTHYPFLQPVLEEMLPDGVTIIDPAPAVARRAKQLLPEIPGPLTPTTTSPWRFLTTGPLPSFRDLLQLLLGDTLAGQAHSVERLNLE